MASKDEHFYRNGIRALPDRWTKVVANDGQYFEWFICNHFFYNQVAFSSKKQWELSCAPNSFERNAFKRCEKSKKKEKIDFLKISHRWTPLNGAFARFWPEYPSSAERSQKPDALTTFFPFRTFCKTRTSSTSSHCRAVVRAVKVNYTYMFLHCQHIWKGIKFV